MIRRLPFAVALLFGCAMSATESSAAPLTFEFTGTVTQINTDPDDPFGGAIAFGTLFTGRYTFDAAAVDAIPSATDGSYLSSGPPSGISVNFDGDPFGAFSLADVFVNTRNGSPDQYGVYSSDGVTEIQFLLESFVNPLTSDLLPLVPPAVGDYASRHHALSPKPAIAEENLRHDSFPSNTSSSRHARVRRTGHGLVGLCGRWRHSHQPEPGTGRQRHAW